MCRSAGLCALDSIPERGKKKASLGKGRLVARHRARFHARTP